MHNKVGYASTIYKGYQKNYMRNDWSHLMDPEKGDVVFGLFVKGRPHPSVLG